MNTGKKEMPAPLPTELDEINYQRIRFWLKEHETEVIALWQDFCTSRYWTVKDDEEGNSEADDIFRNPFSCLYAPKDYNG
jgi:hypothetical protein